MKIKYLVLVALLVPTSAMATHSWNTYHWRSDVAPTVYNGTTSSLYDVPAGVVEWANLGTPIQPLLTTNSKSAKVTVKEAFSPFWLGLARIYLEDGHIVKGEIKLNTRLLKNYGPEVADHVLCQELGHVWGLNHNRNELDTCMNDTTALSNTAPYPNLHDAEQLNLIYAHTDVVPPPDDDGVGGGPPCSKKPDHPNCKAHGWYTVHIFWVFDLN